MTTLQERVPNLDPVLTFKEWCSVNGISPATGHRIIKRGDGPKVIRLSLRRFGVRVSDNQAWQESRLRTGA